MNILLLSPQPFYQVRGTPIAIDLLVSTLSKQGHSVDLLTYHEGDSRDYSHVKHHRIKSFKWLSDVRPGFSIKKILCSTLLFFKAFGLLKRGQYDVVHANEEAVFMAWLFKKLFKTPYVYDMDSSLSDQMLTKLPALSPLGLGMAKIEAMAMRNASGILAVCEALCKVARPHNSYVTLLTDVSMLDLLTPSTDVNDLASDYPLKGTRFMYVGNLESYQGVDLMLEAFVRASLQNPAMSLLIIGGDDVSIKHYQAKASELGVAETVFFVGPKPLNDIAAYMAQADVLLSPRVQGENTPMKIYNYMASGRVMIATQIYSHTQVLDSQVAKLVAPDALSLSAAMVELTADPALRERLASACKKRAEEHYSVRSFEQKVALFFSNLASRIKQHDGHEN